MKQRTRIKICGLTRPQDVLTAVAAGADAVGLVFYPASPRAVDLELARQLLDLVPPFVNTVGLFVNASLSEVVQVCRALPLQTLQFHGDESAAACQQVASAVGLPFLRAVRMRPTLDLIEYGAQYPTAQALLLDADADNYGGSGKVFDWSLIPASLAPQIVLSGGLNAHNVTDAIVRVRPYAVDVSSGVEQAKGIKDPGKILQFIQAVRAADAQIHD